MKSFNTLVNIVKTIGFFNFIKAESKFKEKKNKEDTNKNMIKGYTISVTESLINFFLREILTDQEKVTLKKFEFITNKDLTKKYKKSKEEAN